MLFRSAFTTMLGGKKVFDQWNGHLHRKTITRDDVDGRLEDGGHFGGSRPLLAEFGLPFPNEEKSTGIPSPCAPACFLPYSGSNSLVPRGYHLQRRIAIPSAEPAGFSGDLAVHLYIVPTNGTNVGSADQCGPDLSWFFGTEQLEFQDCADLGNPPDCLGILCAFVPAF